jgi:tetratricopeptide (TPR) repeat protein
MFKRKKSGKSKDDSKKLWEAYLKASLKQEWNKAKDTLQSIITLEPNNSKTHLKMGDLLQKLGDSKGAIKAYHRSASILVKSGFSQKATALYKIILRLDPKDEQALNDIERLAETSEHAAPPLTAFSVEESSPPAQPEESVAALEEFPVSGEITAPEEVPAPDDMPLPEQTPPPADLTSTEETEMEQAPLPEGWPETEGIPSGWPDEEQSLEPQEGEAFPEFETGPPEPQEGEAFPEFETGPPEPQEEEAFPEFETGPPEPQGEETLPEFETGLPEPQEEETLPDFETEVSEAEAEDLLLELCIGPSEPTAEEAIADTDSEAANKPGGEPKAWIGTLPEIFWSLNKEELTQIFNDSVIASFTKGQTIVEEGGEGDSIFAIMDGFAVVQTSLGGESVDLAVLKAGDVFGEVAFLTGKPRTATVVANSDLKVMDISRAVLEKAIEKHPRILSCLAEYYYNRLNDTITKVKKATMPKVRLIVRE